jgi:hypothetical protein
MSLDYLRNLAFSGELANFFKEDPYGLAKRGANGVSLPSMSSTGLEVFILASIFYPDL